MFYHKFYVNITDKSNGRLALIAKCVVSLNKDKNKSGSQTVCAF